MHYFYPNVFQVHCVTIDSFLHDNEVHKYLETHFHNEYHFVYQNFYEYWYIIQSSYRNFLISIS